MDAVVHGPTVVCGVAGSKRSASPAGSCKNSHTSALPQLDPQHQDSCSRACQCKQRRCFEDPSIQNSSPASGGAPAFVIWHDFDNRESNQDSSQMDKIRNIAPHTAAQDGNKSARSTSLTPGDRFEELVSHMMKTNSSETSQRRGEKHVRAEGTEDFESCPTAGGGPQGQELVHNFGDNGRFHHFYTTALILAAGGAFGPKRVEVDSRCPYNLLPWTTATDLALIQYSAESIGLMIAGRLVPANRYCQFTLRMGGVHMTINAYIFLGIETIRLGRPWIRQVSLMSDSGQRYYIPVALTVEGVNEETQDSNKTQVPLGGREDDMATSPRQEYGGDSDEYYIPDWVPRSLIDSETSSDGETSLDKDELAETGQDDGEGGGLGESEYDEDGQDE